MNGFSEEDVRIKQAMSRETASVPPVVRERMERLYASLPELASDRGRYVRHRRLRLGTSIALLLAIVVTVGLVTPTTSEWLRQLTGKGADLFTSAGGTDTIEQTVSDQGIDLELTKVIYDSDYAAITVVHSNAVLPRDPVVLMDGGPLNLITKQEYQGKNNFATEFRFQAAGPQEQSAGSDGSSESHDFVITFSRVLDMRSSGQREVSGHWEFRTTIQDWKQNVKELIYSPPITALTKEGLTVSVTGATVTPLTTTVNYQTLWDKNNADASAQADSFSIRATDVKGTELERREKGGYFNENKEAVSYAIFDNLREGDGEIKILAETWAVPTESSSTEGDGEDGEDSMYTSVVIPLAQKKFPLTLPQGESGDLIVKNIRLGEVNAFIDYELTGSNPYGRMGPLAIVDDKEVIHAVFADSTLSSLTRLRSYDDTGYSYRFEIPNMKNLNANLDPSKLFLREIAITKVHYYPIGGFELVLPLNDN